MLPTSITLRVKDILSEQTGFDESDIFPESKLEEDLGVDSLDFLEVIFVIEEEFDIDIPDKDAGKLVTVQDIVTYVTERAE